MAVAIARMRDALDGSVWRDGHGAGIAFVAVSREMNVYKGIAAHDHVGNSHALAVIQSGAEIRMQWNGGSDEVDDGIGVGIDGRVGDVLVPQAVSGEGNKSVEIRLAASAHLVAGSLSESKRRKCE